MPNALVSYAPSSLTELKDWAKDFAEHFHGPYRGKPKDVVLAVMWGAELGLQPMQSLRAIAVINGKPSVYGDDLVGLAEKYGKVIRRREGFLGSPYDDDFRAWCECDTPAGDTFRQEFSVADAKLAKLWGKAGPWQSNPKRMLQFRARNFCVRDAAPDLGLGPSAEEMREVEDMSEEQRATRARDVTPPRTHSDGRILDPLENVDAANAEAAEPQRVAAADAEIAADPLGINGSGQKAAYAKLADGLASAMKPEQITELYRVYSPRIVKLPDDKREALEAIVSKRLKDMTAQAAATVADEFDHAEDWAELDLAADRAMERDA